MTWLTSKLASMISAGLAVALAVALVVVIVQKNATIDGLRDRMGEVSNQRDAYLMDLTQCRANGITLAEATRRQNEAVATAEAAGQARIDALAKVAATAKASAATAQARAAAILARKGSTCQDAEALILESAR